MSGTLAFVSSLRFSLVTPVKAAHIKDTLFYSIGLCTLRSSRIKNNKVCFLFVRRWKSSKCTGI